MEDFRQFLEQTTCEPAIEPAVGARRLKRESQAAPVKRTYGDSNEDINSPCNLSAQFVIV